MTKYVADVQVEVELEGDEEMAYKVIDETLQRAWDTDQGRKWITDRWHFEMLEGCVTAIEETTETPAETRTRVRTGLGYPPASTDEVPS